MAGKGEAACSEPDVTPLVGLRGISKTFGPVIANDQVTFDIHAGRVLALLGENGAGKSTAMNVLAGLYAPDSGVVQVEGSIIAIGSPSLSVRNGIGMVHQQFKLVETLTGLENVSLAVDRGRLMQRRHVGAALAALIDELGFEIDLARPIWQLSLAHRQQLEILRVIAAGARVLILDEPTSVLSPIESRGLFRIIKEIARSGRAVVLITHKVSEALELADDLVIMRGGRVVFQGSPGTTTIADLSRHIVGNRQIPRSARAADAFGDVMLKLDGLAVRDDRGLPAVRSVSFEVRAGELVVLLGVTGNGQSELLEAIGGLRSACSGRCFLPPAGAGRGFGFIPARHLGTGLAPSMTIRENAILGRQRLPPFGRWLMPSRIDRQARQVAAKFGVTLPVTAPVRRLSGGNLQRIVLGRELGDEPSLVIADYPTRGLDIAAAAEIRKVLVRQAEAGAAVLVSSEDIEEFVGIANRVLVMHGGEIVGNFTPEEIDFQIIGELMTTGGASRVEPDRV
jgi:general nucleoside transport system ATP-binding protein